jgi:hypothetical protein
MNWRHGLAEAALFLVASAAGIYGLGEGLNGFFGTGPADPWWLAVAAVALIVLARQMSRVQDHWPRKTDAADGSPEPTTREAPAGAVRDAHH